MQSGNLVPIGVLSAILLPILGAYFLDSRHKRLRPRCQSFGWGYFSGLIGPISGIVVASVVLQALLASSRNQADSPVLVGLLVVAILLIVTSVLTPAATDGALRPSPCFL